MSGPVKFVHGSGVDAISTDGDGLGFTVETNVDNGPRRDLHRRTKIHFDRHALEFFLGVISARPEWDEHILTLAEQIHRQREREQDRSEALVEKGELPISNAQRVSGRSFGQHGYNVRKLFEAIK